MCNLRYDEVSCSIFIFITVATLQHFKKHFSLNHSVINEFVIFPMAFIGGGRGYTRHAESTIGSLDVEDTRTGCKALHAVGILAIR